MIPLIVKYKLLVTFLTYITICTFAQTNESAATIPEFFTSASDLPSKVRHPAGYADERNRNEITVTPTGTVTMETTPEFTIPYDSQSVECRNIATEFVYDNNLCDARDPESYFSSKTSYYTCVGRCGEILPYSKKGSSMCACDVACVNYGDCCRDIHISCPNIYRSALARYPWHEELTSYCADANYLTVAIKHSKHSNCSSDDDSIRNPDEGIYFNQFPQPPRTLKQLTRGIGHSSVADIATGLVFKDIKEWTRCKAPRSIPYFIPVVIFLDCTRGELTVTVDRTSIATILEWCAPLKTNAVQTPYHRSCSVNTFISCQCGQEFADRLHNACIGPNISVPRLSRHQLSSVEKSNVYPPTRAPCSVSDNAMEIHPSDGNMQISISSLPADYPLTASRQMAAGHNTDFTATSSSSKPRQEEYDENAIFRSNGNNESEDGESKNAHSSEINNTSRNKHSHIDTSSAKARSNDWWQDGRSVKQEDLIHVVEISHTIEKRLLCRSLQNLVTECELLDCARGAILSHGPATGGQFGGSRCLWLTQVVVKNQAPGSGAPICWCIQVVVFLSNLHIWDVKMSTTKNQCVISLAAIHTEIQHLEAYELGMRVHLPDPRTKWTLSFDYFTEQLWKIYQESIPVCYPNSLPEDVNVCFQFSAVDTSRSNDPEVSCISPSIAGANYLKNGGCFFSSIFCTIHAILVVGLNATFLQT